MKISITLRSKCVLLTILGLGLIAALPLIASVTQSNDYHGLISSRVAVDIVLSDENAPLETLFDSGKPSYITFGYIGCQESCPMQIGVIQKLAQDIGDRANIVWVSLNPQADTQNPFDPRIHYIVKKDNQEAQRLAEKYQVYRGKFGRNNESISHRDSIFLIDQSHRIRLVYQGRTITADAMVDDFNKLFRG